MAGIIITFEGIDRCGKGSQIKLLKELLERMHVTHVISREPGGTSYGEAARRMAQDPKFILRLNEAYKDLDVPHLPTNEDLEPHGELFTYLVARSLFYSQRVIPFVAKGGVFIADRGPDSSTAYQGYGLFQNESDVDFVRRANDFATQKARIARTYLLDITVEESERRSAETEFGDGKDRIELREREFFTRVRDGYLSLAKDEPERFLVLDGTLSIEELHARIKADVIGLLREAGIIPTGLEEGI